MENNTKIVEVKLKVKPGAPIEDVARKAAEEIVAGAHRVTFKFNDVDLVVVPGMLPRDVCLDYYTVYPPDYDH